MERVPTEDPRPDGLRRAKSLVVVNTGNGKGKSSSAFGVMLRGLAMDWPVAVVQFIKSGDWHVGEEKMGDLPERHCKLRIENCKLQINRNPH